MAIVVLCTRCGYFKGSVKEIEKCPVCKNKLVSPMDDETYDNMTQLEMDAFLFKIQPPKAYDPDWWQERREHDAEYLYSIIHNDELMEREREKYKKNNDVFIGFNFPL